MNIANFELLFTIAFVCVVALVIINQTIVYVCIDRYEKKVRKLLGKHYASYFNWDIMKNFYDFPREPIEAVREMIAMGRCKSTEPPVRLTDVHGEL